MAGHPDFAGTPLVHGIDILADGFGVLVAGGQTIAFPPFEITRPGYLMNVGTVYTGANGTSGLVSMSVDWYDSGQNVHFGHEAWRMPVGTNGNGYFHTGRGPTKGQLLQLNFTNRDATQQIESTFWLAQTTQHASRDDIRLHLGGVSPVFQDAPGFDPTFNRLANILGQTIVAGHTDIWLLPLYSGQASLFFSCSGQSAANVVELFVVQADLLNNFASDAIIVAGASPFASTPGLLVTLPRKVMSLEIQNTGTTTATYNLSMVAQEYSS